VLVKIGSQASAHLPITTCVASSAVGSELTKVEHDAASPKREREMRAACMELMWCDVMCREGEREREREKES
jgi:hypothetical protein